MKSDNQIQKDVMEELKWQPILNASEIGVAVKNGVVTLSGMVDTYYKKLAAERTAKKVAGVKAVAEDIQIGSFHGYPKQDAEIAQAVIDALKWHAAVQDEKIKISVEDGIVKLEGEVEWDYQRTSAKSAIENLTGVRSVLNSITLKHRVTPSEVRQKINGAFLRSATIDAGKITTDVVGGKVILSGRVRSFVEKDDAETAVWNAPGVTNVENKLEIEAPVFEFEAL